MPPPDRTHATRQFLRRSGWADAVREDLAGDASFRRYERVRLEDQHAVLMDAPPGKEDTRPFLQVAKHLTALGYSAPKILAEDTGEGFLLLEDLGDDSFTRVLAGEPELEATLYEAATEWLVHLHAREESRAMTLPPYDEALYLREVALFSDWFLPAALGQAAAASLREEYLALWKDLLRALPPAAPQFVHRDYHADNLLWLPMRQGVARTGLLDFQDAVLGHPAYDLVSIMEDARRDISISVVEQSLRRYIDASAADERDFRTAYALLGAQRNSKIIGIFTRLAVRDGKPHYLDFLPRVWGHLATDLAHPALAPLRDWLARHVPEEKRGILTLGSAA